MLRDPLLEVTFQLLSNSMNVAPGHRLILVPPPTNGSWCGFTSTCESIPVMMPDVWKFLFDLLDVNINLIQRLPVSRRFTSPPHVCGKYIERYKMLSRSMDYPHGTQASLSQKPHNHFHCNRSFSFLVSLKEVPSNLTICSIFMPIWGLVNHGHTKLTLNHVAQEVRACR